ncbi:MULTISPECIES: hypothetical protein [Halorussus]|uniref:DUF7282 domain-containing protein n=1 Tax=Halorussus TaxID=1070314 RepID=UPI000E214D3C|nr:MULTISPECIES: hypothetical protein [Halorussus]NHN61097.1 hypothetical protein [Halorussus sp. JP-T4]
MVKRRATDRRTGSGTDTAGGDAATGSCDSDTETSGLRSAPSRRQFLAASFVAGALGVPGASAAATGDGGDRQSSDAEAFATVEFGNQYTDGTDVTVGSTTVSAGGWVTFHDTSLFEAKPLESVVGISEYLEPGIHREVPATLFDVPGRSFERSQLEGTTPLIAMPHRDTNDNQQYEFVTSEAEQDPQYLRAELPVVDLGFATVGEASDGGAAPFAALDFENQAVEDDAVTVEDVVLSDGGFVALHDVRLLRGEALESVVGVSEYLEPGAHDAVEVELDDPSAVAGVEFPPAPPLVPMPHRDTDGNEEYDFVESGGEDDGPYVAAGQAVVDMGFVKIGE